VGLCGDVTRKLSFRMHPVDFYVGGPWNTLKAVSLALKDHELSFKDTVFWEKRERLCPS
jgi:hypothetical protein